MLALGTPDFSDEHDVAELADWAELASATSSRPLSEGLLQTSLAREGRRDEDPAARATEVWAELVRRSELCSQAWPLRISRSGLISRPGHPNALLHYFLCSLSLGTEVSFAGRRLFEHCVTDVIRALSANNGLRTGSPRSNGLPSALDDAVDLYVRLSSEQKRAPLLQTDKDYGLDVVTWRFFADRRGGFLQFIGQCATGKDWYEEGKLTELQVRAWEDHVAWAVEPVRFFAVPFVIPPQHWWRAARKAGLLLDRPRLLELALTSPPHRRRRGELMHYCRRLYQGRAA
jgi:hypothetical protein